jgi:hypothetical protein
VFRSTRGNALTFFNPIEHPIKDFCGVEHHKTVYVVTFQETPILREKIHRICDSFHSERFELPKGSFASKIYDIEKKITETQNIMNITKTEIKSYLISIN